MKAEIKNFQKLLIDSRHAIFFGGAGVSTESGIPDFRGVNGIYQQKFGLRPEYMLSAHCFLNMPQRFFEFYRENILHLDARPNRAHYALAGMEAAGRLLAVVTQNIDELHQLAGSKEVIELHGSVWRNYCVRCGKPYYGANIALLAAGIGGRPEDAGLVPREDGVPQCACGGCVRPDVVLYGEELPRWEFNRAARLMEQADMLIIGGTSLSVHPAASLIDYFNTERRPVVMINKEATHLDEGVAVVIRQPIAEVMAEATGLEIKPYMM